MNNYPITTEPKIDAWDFIPLVNDFQNNMPKELAQKVEEADHNLKALTFAATANQKVVEKNGTTAELMAIEFTRGFIDVPYEEFIIKLPPDMWGKNLAHYLGGDLKPITSNSDEKRQIERMVLSALNYDPKTEIDRRIIPKLDMTKTEIIRYTPDSTKIYWRVYHSDNGTVDSDIGSLEFKTHGNGTLVTFHSAHNLSFDFAENIVGEQFKLEIVQDMLSKFFVDSIKKYGQTVR